jgi:hypothetical protein
VMLLQAQHLLTDKSRIRLTLQNGLGLPSYASVLQR